MFNKKIHFSQVWGNDESAKAGYQERQVPGTIPNIPLASLRITESDCTLRPRNEQKGLLRNYESLQRPAVPPKYSASFDSQMPPRVGHQQAASLASTPKFQPPRRNGSLLTKDDTKFLFQPLDRPTSNCESPTGLLKPLPISYQKWRELHRVSEATNSSVHINGNSHRQMAAKKYVLDTIKTVTYSDSHLVNNDPNSSEFVVKNNQQRQNTLPNSVHKTIATMPGHLKSLYPNASDTGVSSFYRIRIPHPATPDDISSNSSSSDHTLVGNHSLTTEETLTEERLRELSDSGGGQSPSYSSSPETICKTRTPSRSPSSEEELFHVAFQSQGEQISYQEKDTTPEYIRTPSVESGSSVSSYTQYKPPQEERGGTSATRVGDNLLHRSTVTNDSPPLPSTTDDRTGNRETPQTPSKIDITESQMMHWAKIGSYVRECYQKRKICDVRFYVENEVLYAHQAPLCTVSPYFASMFYENNYLHSKAMAEVRLRGISMQSLKVFMDFVYTGKLEINTSTLLDLVKISGQFEVPEIRQRCISEIDFLHDEDLIRLLVVVREDPSLDFMEPLMRSIADRFLSVCVSESFLELDVDTLCLILSNDRLLTHSEMDVFCAGIKWVNYCPEQRSQLLEMVMKCVRFPVMTQTNLFECLEMSSILRTNERCLSMIHKANWIRTAIELNRDDPLNLDIPSPRRRSSSDQMTSEANHTNNNASSGHLMDISFGSANSEKSCATMIERRDKMEQYSASYDQLQFAKESSVKKTENKIINQSSSTRIEKSTMVVLDKQVYVIGGLYQDQEPTTPRRDAWLYSPKNGWQGLAPMKISRVGHTVCAVGGYIYAIGGLGSNNRLLTSVERYDPVSDSWCFVRSMSTARAGACAAELNGFIFVAGGYGDSQGGASAITDIVECYDPFTNRWEQKCGLRFGRCNANLTRVGDTMYLSGGLATDRNKMDTVGVPDVDVYDVKNDRWRLNNYMLPDAIHRSTASFASGPMLYLIGGLPDSGQSEVECLDTRRKVWLEDFSLPKEVLWMQRVTSRDVAYF